MERIFKEVCMSCSSVLEWHKSVSEGSDCCTPQYVAKLKSLLPLYIKMSDMHCGLPVCDELKACMWLSIFQRNESLPGSL
jgi:hypothetical protein